jgi:hypothetical protein
MLTLDETIQELREMGDVLVPYNWPQNDPALENDLNFLKMRQVCVDGYNFSIHFSRADYTTHFMETVQIVGEKTPFLPFATVQKVARKILGEAHLYLIELFKENRKIYCWTLTLDREGKPRKPMKKHRSIKQEYNGFSYRYMHPSQVKFY